MTFLSSPAFHVVLVFSVIIAAAALVMTLVNLGYYRGTKPSPRRPAVRGDTGHDVTVAVCIPARNEETNIEACVRSALDSDHPRVEALVYDDQSTDRTPEILAALTQSDPRVIRADTRPLPAGWVGKQWACERLGCAALDRGADWLLFTDADVRFDRAVIPAALDAARRLDADLISTFPRQITGSLAERLIVPLIHFILFSYLPMGQMRGSNSPAASAGCGQFLFVSRRAYEACGGHAAWPDSMHDGIRMPRAVRSAGLHSDLFDARDLVRCRMYRGLAQTWRGFAKNAYEGLGSLPLLIFLTALHIVGHVLPPLLILLHLLGARLTTPALILASVAALLALAQRLVLARHFSQSLIGALLHPLGVALMTAIQWHSFALHLSGKRQWRGRTTAPQAASTP
ncbi:MAG: glycosyltransferase family 2 protein [Planctomycetota bacterium]|nr:glycosyltransferase family 2 protein [Planctomycetota bacterium]